MKDVRGSGTRGTRGIGGIVGIAGIAGIAGMKDTIACRVVQQIV